MHKTITYPEREHLNPVSSFSDVLQFELSIHSDSTELKKGIDFMFSMYETFPLGRSLLEYSRLVEVSHLMTEPQKYLPEMSGDFHGGAILATHCVLRSQTAKNRGALLQNDMFKPYHTNLGSYDIPVADIEGILMGLIDWRNGDFKKSFEAEPAEIQSFIVEAAVRLYSLEPQDKTKKDSFISGFMMAKDLLEVELYKIESNSTEDMYLFHGPPVL